MLSLKYLILTKLSSCKTVGLKKWSKETIKKGIQIRFTVGITGFHFVLKMKNYPIHHIHRSTEEFRRCQ